MDKLRANLIATLLNYNPIVDGQILVIHQKTMNIFIEIESFVF